MGITFGERISGGWGIGDLRLAFGRRTRAHSHHDMIGHGAVIRLGAAMGVRSSPVRYCLRGFHLLRIDSQPHRLSGTRLQHRITGGKFSDLRIFDPDRAFPPPGRSPQGSDDGSRDVRRVKAIATGPFSALDLVPYTHDI